MALENDEQQIFVVSIRVGLLATSQTSQTSQGRGASPSRTPTKAQVGGLAPPSQTSQTSQGRGASPAGQSMQPWGGVQHDPVLTW